MTLNPLLMPIFFPLVVGFLLLFLPGRMRFSAKMIAIVVSISALIAAVRIFTTEWLEFVMPILRAGDLKLDLLLVATPLSKFILLFATGFGVLITLYSLKSMAGAKRLNEYYGAILITIGGSAGVLLSNHLLLLLIFWEIVTASLYLLITIGGRDANFAATKSFAMIGFSDGALLLGSALVWLLSDTFVLSNITVEIISPLAVIAFLLLLIAAVTKVGAMPLHTWLPVSGEFAPVSVMAILPAAIDKLLGIYLLVIVVRRIFLLDSSALPMILAVIGAVTIVVGGMVALVQRNLKKLLSYSAISQAGYIILGIATGTPVGLVGAVFHLINNAIYKSCLFLCGGAVEQATGTAQLDKLGGLGKKMPLTFATCLIAALSISGIPPFNGFVSKWMIYQGLIQMGAESNIIGAGLWPIWLVAAIFGGALTLAYSVKLIHSMFLSRLPSELKQVKEVSIWMTGPMVVLALLCIIFGVFYLAPLRVFIYPALNIAPGTAIFGTWESTLATALIIFGLIAGVVILLAGLIGRKVRAVPTWSCGEIQPSDEMIVPGTHFYNTVSAMSGLKQLYSGQEKGHFDPYNQSGKVGLVFTGLLRWLHNGMLPRYTSWMAGGLLVILFVICKIR